MADRAADRSRTDPLLVAAAAAAAAVASMVCLSVCKSFEFLV